MHLTFTVEVPNLGGGGEAAGDFSDLALKSYVVLNKDMTSPSQKRVYGQEC